MNTTGAKRAREPGSVASQWTRIDRGQFDDREYTTEVIYTFSNQDSHSVDDGEYSRGQEICQAGEEQVCSK